MCDTGPVKTRRSPRINYQALAGLPDVDPTPVPVPTPQPVSEAKRELTPRELAAKIVGLPYWEGLDIRQHMATTASALFFRGTVYLTSRMDRPVVAVVKMALYRQEDIVRESALLKRIGEQTDHVIQRLAFYREPWPVLVLEAGEPLVALDPAPHVAKILLGQVASALECMHARLGLVHGDVNAGSIVVTADGKAKLIDFRWCGEEGVVPPQGFAVWNDAPEAIAGAPLVSSMDVWGLGGLLVQFYVDMDLAMQCRARVPVNRLTASEARARLA